MKYWMQDLKQLPKEPAKPVSDWIYVLAFIGLCVIAFFTVEILAIELWSKRT